MEWSIYNILYKSETAYFIYNSLSNFFAEIDKHTFNLLKELKNNTDEIEKYEDLEFLKNKKIIVNSNTDEFNRLKYNALLNRFSTEGLSLTIAPTQNCNFNCTYCFENSRVNLRMDDKTQENLLEFIEKFKELNYINIEWYGGEPLMEFERIKSISREIKKINNNLKSFIITNGYLLTEEKINALDELNIQRVQITLDGKEKSHNKRRFLKNGEPTYQKILDNIQKLVSLKPHISLAIRVNIDYHNKNEFIDVYQYFTEKYPGGKVIVYPAFVNDNVSGCGTDCFVDNKEKSKYIIDLMKTHNIYNHNFYPIYNKNNCMAKKINSFLIGPDGGIYKCWNKLGDDSHKIGNINNLSSEYNSLLTAKYMLYNDYLEDEDCIKCNLFPVCSGGCPLKRIENKGGKHNQEGCHLAKNYLHDFLGLHFKFSKKKKECS